MNSRKTVMNARDIITEAVPCNIVYGRPQVADKILEALTAAGWRLVGPDEVDPVTAERMAEEADAFADRHDDAAMRASDDGVVARFRGGETAIRNFAKRIRAIAS